jgi:hypothetical protein
VINKNDIKNFVERIERRNGLASLHEIFVEMITLYNESGLAGRPIDTLPVNKQLSYMWEKLRGI